MNISKIITLFLIGIAIISCGKTIKLSREDFKWIPYKGTETIVFNSNTGEADTIFLLGTNRESVPNDPLDVVPTNIDNFSIGMKHTDPVSMGEDYRYLESDFLGLSAGENGEPYLTIHFAAKDAWFYGGDFLDLKELDAMKRETLETKLKTYTDIIILTPGYPEYADRKEFLTKLYWSKSEGLIRYDKKEGVYWELVKKYNP